MNEDTARLLEKALAISPDDWETRSHLMAHYLDAGNPERAAILLEAAPTPPEAEEFRLTAARVQVGSDPEAALASLQAILAANRGCARAYLLLAQLYLKRGLVDEARSKYGAATVIDESLADPKFEALIGVPVGPKITTPKKVQGDGPLKAVDPLQRPDAEVSEEEIASALRDLQEGENYGTPKTTFADVGGMKDVIERIRMNIIYPFESPEVFQKYKRRPGGGVLMYGPPGCGKTHIARATAGECGATFISIAITDVLSKWIGESERRLHEIFEYARRRSPTVVFIDEVDALGVSRGDAGSSMAPVVNVLLTELDGISARNENLMVLAATNIPWKVDSALRRPGRFDRVIFVPPPDEAARATILRIHLGDLPAEPLDLEKLARLTKLFSGADLRSLVERATETVIAEELRNGPGAKLTQRILADTIKEMRPSTTEWLETARSYAAYANRSGLYDDLATYLEKH
jgi:SpoVK/Ycf46/Vps4 family AAA+-type ATPase